MRFLNRVLSCAVSNHSATKGQWDVFAGVVVERKPVITQKMDASQEKYMKLMSQLEFEISKKSDHEVRHEKDKKMLEQVKSGEIDLGNVQTARDDEDKWTAEAQNFTPANTTTDADVKKDVRSLNRALDSHLLLVVEQKLGKDYRWICPHSKLENNETLRQAAERMIQKSFPDLKTQTLGHAPWGFYKYKYPQQKDGNVQTSVGAKVFFYKAQVVSGEPKLSSEKGSSIKDFVWLTREELLDKLQPEYYKKLSECLIEE